MLVASTDGVGTKLAVAVDAGRLGTIGVDLVAMCVDDLVCQGAEPLFFLDYQLWGHLDPEAVATIMQGLPQGCRQAGCAILGGELAEHPGQLPPGEMDLAGFAVGVVEKDRLLGPAGPTAPREGDVLVGLHSRRPALQRLLAGPGGPAGAGRAARWTTRPGRAPPTPWPTSCCGRRLIYTPAVLALLAQFEVHAVAHITGGGLPGNLPRAAAARPRRRAPPGTWPVPRIFSRGAEGGRCRRRRDGPHLQHGPGHGRGGAAGTGGGGGWPNRWPASASRPAWWVGKLSGRRPGHRLACSEVVPQSKSPVFSTSYPQRGKTPFVRSWWLSRTSTEAGLMPPAPGKPPAPAAGPSRLSRRPGQHFRGQQLGQGQGDGLASGRRGRAASAVKSTSTCRLAPPQRR